MQDELTSEEFGTFRASGTPSASPAGKTLVSSGTFGTPETFRALERLDVRDVLRTMIVEFE